MNYQINTMDYFSLVNMLMGQLTPQLRAKILEKLTDMNNQLLYGMAGVSSHRKKDAVELPHPALDQYNYRQPNPVPRDIPISGNRFENAKDIHEIEHDHEHEHEVDIDDIIEDIYEQNNQPDSLDIKLAHIKKLQDKIIADQNRRKQKNRSKRKMPIV